MRTQQCQVLSKSTAAVDSLTFAPHIHLSIPASADQVHHRAIASCYIDAIKPKDGSWWAGHHQLSRNDFLEAIVRLSGEIANGAADSCAAMSISSTMCRLRAVP